MANKNELERIVLRKIDSVTKYQEQIEAMAHADVQGMSNEKLQSLQHATRSCIKVLQEIGKKALLSGVEEDDANALVCTEYVDDPDTGAGMLKELMNIGFVAAYNGMQKEAEAIFTGIHAMRSSSELPLIGLAASHLSAGNLTAAVDILNDQALVINPDSDYAKGYLALLYKLMGNNNKSQLLIDELIQSNADESAVRMVKGVQKMRYEFVR